MIMNGREQIDCEAELKKLEERYSRVKVSRGHEHEPRDLLLNPQRTDIHPSVSNHILNLHTMDDQELAAIRAARLQQLRQSGSAEASLSGDGAQIPSETDAADAAKRANEEQMRRDMLATLLDSKARERRMYLKCLTFVKVHVETDIFTSCSDSAR